jgi:hypothetical protein
MLNVVSTRKSILCDGSTRRDFLKVGALGLGGLALPDLLRARAAASATGQPTRNTSVVWLWLGGGASHIETFDPKMSAPAEFRSTTGAVQTNVPGIEIGGSFERMARLADKMAFIRSFAHNSSGHTGGTVWMNTGYQSSPENEQRPLHPSHGSMLSRFRGASNPSTGLPTYVRLSAALGGSGPSWLGSPYAPFSAPNGNTQGLNLAVSAERVNDRRALRQSFDSIDREVDRSGVLEGLDSYEQQAFSLIQGSAREAFDVLREDRATLALYGVNGPQPVPRAVNQPGFDQDGTANVARHLLLARRLCEAGAGLVTVAGGSWDMHGQNPRMQIEAGMRRMGTVIDHAVSAFLQDVHNRGLQNNILLVITGDFGRTPRINRNAGRDHWGTLCTLALAGGGLRMGQIVGESNPRAEAPRSMPIRPVDLMATLFHVLGMPQDLHFNNATGRPIPMIRGGRPIRELV